MGDNQPFTPRDYIYCTFIDKEENKKIIPIDRGKVQDVVALNRRNGWKLIKQSTEDEPLC